MDDINTENLNIIKKIIDDFENNAQNKSKSKKRVKSCKISQSDSLIHRYRRCQISPKSGGSLDGAFFRVKRGDSLDEFAKTEDELYINFIENGDDSGNADANVFKPRIRKSFAVRGSVTGVDEVKVYMESKKHQDRVNKNVNEVRL